MKRIITLMLAAGLFMGATAATAEASAEINVSGKYVMTGAYTNNPTGSNGLLLWGDTGSDFSVRQRIEMDLSFSNSENLSAHMRLRMPARNIWGESPFGVGGGALPIDLKLAYVDWYVPSTDVMVRMGLQAVALPTVLGSSVLDDFVAGVSVIAPFNDMVSLTAHWLRPVDDTAGNYNTSSGLDVLAVTLPVTMDAFSITPWFAYGMATDATAASLYATYSTPSSNYAASVPHAFNTAALTGESNWWLGFTSAITAFDPFSIALGFTYGSSSDVAGVAGRDSAGWLLDAKLAYNGGMYGVPALFGWYSTGDDFEGYSLGDPYSPIIDYNRIAQLSGGWAPTVTNAFFDQSMHGIAPNAGVYSASGTWALGLSYTGFQPTEAMTMGGHVKYVAGTNDYYSAMTFFDPNYLTNEDSFWEIAVYSTYEIYKDLQAAVEFNYMITDFANRWNTTYDLSGNRVMVNDGQNVFRATVGFRYMF